MNYRSTSLGIYLGNCLAPIDWKLPVPVMQDNDTRNNMHICENSVSKYTEGRDKTSHSIA